MNEDKKSNVKSLSEEKYTALSVRNGWPLGFAQGFVGGQIERRRGNPPSSYILAGIDQYALGFRAGYFVRPNQHRVNRRAVCKPGVDTRGQKVSATLA